MKKSKHLMAMLLVFIMVFSTAFAGCSSKDATTDSDATVTDSASDDVTEAASSDTAETASSDAAWDTGKEDTITLCVINNYYTAGEKKLAEEYMALHPETKVIVDVISDNDSYVTKMQTTLSGDKKNAADIVHGNFAASVVGGNMSVGIEKGYFYDMAAMLDETNPYNDGKKVREAFDDADIATALNGCGGIGLGYLPFDKCGVSFYYNKTVFDKYGLTVPSTYEDLVEICETLKANGYEKPISAGAESEWLINFFADACYRSSESEYLILPGDGIYDESTMSIDDGFTFDENDLACDTYVVNSTERQMKYAKDNGVNTAANKKVWSVFQGIAKYFTENWIAADSAQIISDFETQVTPILFNGSWNAGLILSDISQLPSDSQFEWATFQLQSFENTPEGFSQKIRGLYVLGNCMSIIQKDDEDHMARVKDFYKFWYSPKQATTCYEETLSNGNFVQGPCIIKGVALSEDLNSKLNGFIATGNARTFSWASGQTWCLQADKPIYNDLVSQLSVGSITVDSFLEQLDPLYRNYTDDQITKAGFDLDPATADTAAE